MYIYDTISCFVWAIVSHGWRISMTFWIVSIVAIIRAPNIIFCFYFSKIYHTKLLLLFFSTFSLFLKYFRFLLHNFVAKEVVSRLHKKYLHVCQWKIPKNLNAFFQDPSFRKQLLSPIEWIVDFDGDACETSGPALRRSWLAKSQLVNILYDLRVYSINQFLYVSVFKLKKFV